VREPLQYYLSGEFFKEYILFERGPLMAAYYTWGDGRQIDNDPEHDHGDMEVMSKYRRNQYDFISEGDSPAYFYLLDVGLRSHEDPSYGGWGGRFIQSNENPKRWEDGQQVTDFNPYTQQDDPTFPQTRWIKDFFVKSHGSFHINDRYFEPAYSHMILHRELGLENKFK
jgi:hypothetical protein